MFKLNLIKPRLMMGQVKKTMLNARTIDKECSPEYNKTVKGKCTEFV